MVFPSTQPHPGVLTVMLHTTMLSDQHVDKAQERTPITSQGGTKLNKVEELDSKDAFRLMSSLWVVRWDGVSANGSCCIAVAVSNKMRHAGLATCGYHRLGHWLQYKYELETTWDDGADVTHEGG